MSSFEDIRKVTGATRPPGGNGKLVEVIPGLFTAPFTEVQDKDTFKRLELEHPMGLVVNAASSNAQCATSTGYYGPEVEVLPLEVFDEPKDGETHAGPSDIKQLFPLVNSKIKETINSGKSAVVHCQASKSRAAALTIAYLMESQSLSALEATTLLKSKFDGIWPNDKFVGQLLEFEAELQAKKN